MNVRKVTEVGFKVELKAKLMERAVVVREDGTKSVAWERDLHELELAQSSRMLREGITAEGLMDALEGAVADLEEATEAVQDARVDQVIEETILAAAEHGIPEDERDYDPRLHVTAGELRKLGVELPEKIPDVAWVPRAALRFGKPEAEMDGEDSMTVTVPVEALEAFRWVRIEFTVPEEQREDLDETLEEMAEAGEIDLR